MDVLDLFRDLVNFIPRKAHLFNEIHFGKSMFANNKRSFFFSFFCKLEGFIAFVMDKTFFG
ncbi:hypothetical protein D3C80_1199640 [compost metagenome]